jgi:hypothetical protein
MMQTATPMRQQFCDRASQMVWDLLNSRLIQRAASKTKPSQVKLAAELPFEHKEYGRTLLLLDGLRMRPYSKGRIPLMFGDENTVRGIVGSVLAMTTIERVLYGEVQFASDPDAQAIAQRWNAGELSHEVEFEFSIDDGKKVGPDQSFFGFKGPFLVGKTWSPVCVRIQP